MAEIDSFIKSDASLQASPFAHFHLPRLLSNSREQALLEQLSMCDSWTLRVEDDFYEVFDLDRSETTRLSAIADVSSHSSRVYLLHLMQRIFRVELEDRVEFFVQKMVAGFRNRVHNDWGPRAQTHRLVIQINAGWPAGNGGILMLFDEEYPAAPKPTHRYYLPISGSAVGFEISESSFHAVSPVKIGTRFTLVYSFFKK